MPVVWENSFDGPDQTAVTVSNSANYGDAVGEVRGTVVYDAGSKAVGSASILLGGPSVSEYSGFATTDWTAGPVGVRFYVALPPPNSRVDFRLVPSDSGTDIRFTLYSTGELNEGGNTYTGAMPTDGRWTRVEIAASTSQWTIRTFFTDRQSTTYDYEQSFNLSFAPTGTWNFWAEDWAEDGVNIDAVIALDEEVWPGPAETVPYEAHSTVDVSAAAEGTKQVQSTASTAIVATATASGTGVVHNAANATIEATASASGEAGFQGSASHGVDVATAAEGTKQADQSASAQVQVGASAQGSSFTVLPDVPIIGLLYRFVAYAPNGDRLGQLPMPLSFQLGVPLNDMPSLAFEYVRDAPNAELLDQPCEVAIELAALDTGVYREYPGCRFLNLREQHDYSDRAGVHRYTMPHYGWQLRKVRNINTAALNDEYQRQFDAATPGRILHTLLSEAQDRGNIDGLIWDFTEFSDSDGNSWSTTLTVAYDLGQDLWSILRAMQSDGLIDWRFDKRTLQVYNVDTFLDRDRTEQVSLLHGRDILEAPDDATYEELAARVFVKGVEGVTYSELDGTALTPWGNWEDVVNLSGVADHGTMATAAQARLSQTSRVRTQMTRAIAFPTTYYLPFRDYRPGDTIMLPSTEGIPRWEARVRQISLKSLEPHSVEGNLVVNDRFVERDLRMDRTLAALTGSTGTPGGSGGGGSEDTRTPAQVTGLVLATDTFLNELGEPRGQITAGWSPVTEATNGTDMNISAYEVWIRQAITGGTWQQRTTVDSPDTEAFMSPFEVGQTYQFAVRAVGRNNRRGAFSTVESIVPSPDTEPPPVPSEPVVDTRLGVIRIFWDGLSDVGTAMPIDFDYVAVYMSETGAAATFEQIDTIYREGTAVVPDQPYGEERFFYLTAFDRSGNESGPTGTYSAIPERVVENDITPGSIAYELLQEGAVRDDILDDEAVTNRSIAAGAVTAEKVRAYSIFADRLAIGTTQNLYYDSGFTEPDLTALRASQAPYAGADWTISFPTTFVDNETDRSGALITADVAVPGGFSSFSLLKGAVDDGFVHQANGANVSMENAYETGDATAVSTTIDVYVSGLEDGQLWVFPRWNCYNATGDNWFWTNSFDSEKSTITEDGYYQISYQEPVGGSSFEVTYMVPVWEVQSTSGLTPAGVQIFLVKPRMVATTGTTLIENGAVTTDKVAANAITAGKIEAGSIDAVHISANAIETEQLSADAITAKHTITGALIQTEATANRGIKLRSTGLFAYNSTGTQTVSLSATSGEFSAVGRIQTGYNTEPRAILDSNVYAGRPGTQYDVFIAYELQPCIFGESSGGSFGDGSLVLLSGETNINSSGRTRLTLGGQGTGFYLGTEYRGQAAAVSSDYPQIIFFGRLPPGDTTDGLFAEGEYDANENTSGTVTYGTPAAGARRPVATEFAAASFLTGNLGLTSYSNTGFNWASAGGGIQGLTYLAWRYSVFSG